MKLLTTVTSEENSGKRGRFSYSILYDSTLLECFSDSRNSLRGSALSHRPFSDGTRERSTIIIVTVM